jgi:transcriptional regulator with XRE-family HTH domain
MLIEAAREKAGLSRREAARRAGISDSWWRYVAAGWQNGPITGTAETVAAMARVAGVDPGRLETEGERPDAATVLRGLLRDETPPPLRAVPDRPLPDGDPEIAALIRDWPELEAIWALATADGKPYPREERIRLMKAHIDTIRRKVRELEIRAERALCARPVT